MLTVNNTRSLYKLIGIYINLTYFFALAYAN